ncbi:MAG: prolipoprotein diacylglyceryl transferase [Syntrophothermus sp.]
MRPELFKIGPLTVYSYGLMLGIAFIVASYLLTKEVERRKLNPKVATEVTLLAIVFGIIGGKLFYLIENWQSFISNPISMAFSPGGLTYYGGLILALIAITIYLKIKKIPWFTMGDLVAPSLAIAYGIGRIGCHLAGDGDYGIPTNLPWGTNYENGTVPPSLMFSDPELLKHYPDIQKAFPNGVPDNTPLHPTSVYEFLSALIIFEILWKLRKKQDWSDGKLFMLYFMLSGFSRLMVEFIRLNPRILFGLSEAQLISVVLIIIGAVVFVYLSKKPVIKYIPAVQSSTTTIKKKKSKV